ncbi:DUF4174 domain-containing protein [Hymenobacter siberiensis]|uniref:DUF4174 domain-containing protein n=1 Tax=Hymenobacter siberiensis TaxID=2848396 RepID=UPI001C1E8CC6|nr:DUF4174 domain-containing protein [Hymenobacter siberiensis]MBU6122621.1 DUF4174 domain-containing protein [Hymenobacter siberiensis]
MKRLRFLLPAPLLLLGLLLLTAQTSKPMPLEQTLREYRWKKRVLLLAAPTAEQADFKAQKALLAAEKAGMAARDFVVLEVFYNQLSTTDQQFLTKKTGVSPPAFAAVLIGKDGGVKERSSHPIQPAILFGTVDKMPMRREEMRQK